MEELSRLTVDPLAYAALGGFGLLVLIMLGIIVWFSVKATKKPGQR